jgi:hypothetical protein
MSCVLAVAAADTHLDGTGENVAVVGKTGRKGRAVVERVLGATLGELLLSLEGVNLTPEVEHIVLRSRDVDRLGGYLVSIESSAERGISGVIRWTFFLIFFLLPSFLLGGGDGTYLFHVGAS